MAAKKDQSALLSLRAELKKELGDDIVPEMAKSIRAALDSMKTEYVECEHCYRKTRFVIPNYFERVKAAQMVISELEGKIGTHKEAPAQVRVKVGNMEDMSDDDLLALVQGGDDGEVDDGSEEEDSDE